MGVKVAATARYTYKIDKVYIHRQIHKGAAARVKLVIRVESNRRWINAGKLGKRMRRNLRVNGTNIIVLHQCRLLTMSLSRDCDFIGCYLNSKTRAGLNSS